MNKDIKIKIKKIKQKCNTAALGITIAAFIYTAFLLRTFK